MTETWQEPQRHKGHKERPQITFLDAAFLCALCVFVVLTQNPYLIANCMILGPTS